MLKKKIMGTKAGANRKMPMPKNKMMKTNMSMKGMGGMSRKR